MPKVYNGNEKKEETIMRWEIIVASLIIALAILLSNGVYVIEAGANPWQVYRMNKFTGDIYNCDKNHNECTHVTFNSEEPTLAESSSNEKNASKPGSQEQNPFDRILRSQEKVK
jgi:hypothetical protein